MFRSQFAVYQRLIDLKEEDRIALLEQWKTGAKSQITDWWTVNADVSSAAEIREAINDTPPGGICLCNLTQGVEFVASSDIRWNFENKKVYVCGNRKHSLNIIWDSQTNLIRGSGIFVFCELPEINITITEAITRRVSLFWTTFRYKGEAYSQLATLSFGFNCYRLTIDDQSGNDAIKVLASSDLRIAGSLTVVIPSSGASTVKLQDMPQPRRLSVDSGAQLVDENGNNLSWSDYLLDVIRDSNGIPRNVISSVVL